MKPNRRTRFIFIMAVVLTLALNGSAWAQTEVPGGIMDEFIAQTNQWWGILRDKALTIFKLVLIIDICLFGFRMAMPGTNVAEIFKEFVSLLVFAGFIALVIVNYEDWSKAVAINGLTGLVGDLTSENFSVDRPFKVARLLWTKTSIVSTSVELNQMPKVMLYMFAVCLLVIALFFLCSLMILVKCEFYIVANIGILLIGLGGSKIFKDYATNVMRYILSIGLKIFVIQLLANVGLSMVSVDSILDSAKNVGGVVTIAWPTIFVLIAKVSILIVLAKTLPDSCAGMISGSTVGGGNAMAAMSVAAASAAMSGGTKVASQMVSGAKSGASMLKNANTVAKESGASGIVGRAKGIGSAFKVARDAAKTAAEQRNFDTKPGSLQNQLRSMANQARADKNISAPSVSAAPSASPTPSTPTTPSTPPSPSSQTIDMRKPNLGGNK